MGSTAYAVKIRTVPAKPRGTIWMGTVFGSRIKNQKVHNRKNKTTIGRSASDKIKRLPKTSISSEIRNSQKRKLKT
jgi:hypothetical protein